VVVLLVPLSASIVTGVWLSRVVGAPHGWVVMAAWYVAIIVASMAVLFAIDAVARRLLPLAALLRVALVFPDRAPSRLAIALEANSAKRLAARMEEACKRGERNGRSTDAVLTLAAALNAHDRRTRGHSERVRALTDLMSEQLGLSADDAERLRWAAFLHDVGKLSVPTRVLNKSGALDRREWRLIRLHPVTGEQLAQPMAGFLGEWVHGIGHHHERFDGQGYPDGLAGDAISLAGRIVSVTDAFETMTAVRSYNRPLSAIDARQELTRCAGTHFDPAVVRAFLNVSIGRLRWTMGLVSWLAQVPFLGVPARASAQVATTAAGVHSGAGPVIGAIAVAVTGVATPLRHVAGAGAVAEDGVGAKPVPAAGIPAAHRTATAIDSSSNVTTTDDTGSATDTTPGGNAETGAGQGDGGPGAGGGPGNGAGQGGGGPGAGGGAGNGAGQGQGNPSGQGHGGGDPHE